MSDKLPDGIRISLTNGTLKLEVCTDNIIRVAFATNQQFFNRRTLATEVRRDEKTRWSVKRENDEAILATTKIQARVNLTNGVIRFFDAAGNPILAEEARKLTPAEVQGEQTFHAQQRWTATPGEALFGLGQQQLGLTDLKSYDLDLWQHNGTVAVPFLVSSRGYGILWDNLSYSRFGDLRPFEPISPAQLFTKNGSLGGLTGNYFKDAKFDQFVAKSLDNEINIEVGGNETRPNELIHPALPPTGDVSVRWEGEVEANETGDHQFQTYSCGDIKLWVDGQLIINHWRQGWLPWYDLAKVHLEAGRRYRIKLEWVKDQGTATVRLLWKTPAHSPATLLWSEVGGGVDYYFVYGPQLDDVIAGYRRLTGQAPMMPLWAYGFWQSRERYQTAQEVLDVLQQFRERSIPLDNIVQDWRYWKLDQWGSHQFDLSRYPHPAGWINSIHDKFHAHLMISVWGKFYPGTENFELMHTNGFLYEGTLQRGIKDWLNLPYAFYDAFNPAAGKMFWAQINDELFSKGVDAWWMDATEPDIEQPMPTLDGQRDLTNPNALGTGARTLNAYALANSRTIYEGQRTTAPDQRVCILTRSAFAGQQRYAAAVWSGDISSTWTALRKQIPAGLGFALSGMPYWTTDIGGFAVPNRWNGKKMSVADEEEWRELQTRWFQFGTFCPLFRSHGQSPAREMWNIAPHSHPAYQTQLKFDRLRYRLMPYIYSLGGAVTHAGGTIMRPLVMDFQTDTNAWRIGDEFMFGPAMLVSPVTVYKTRTRPVYLPPTPGGWYDFWSGSAIESGQTIESPAPFDSLPVHVRAGSIIPLGPELQFTSEKPADPLTLFVYAGADGAFTLYEDDGLSYGYEKGKSSRIPIRWDDARRTLTIGQREGSFRGMLKQRTIEIVLMTKNKPVGFSFAPKPDRSTKYEGKTMEVKCE